MGTFLSNLRQITHTKRLRVVLYVLVIGASSCVAINWGVKLGR